MVIMMIIYWIMGSWQPITSWMRQSERSNVLSRVAPDRLVHDKPVHRVVSTSDSTPWLTRVMLS